MKRYRLVDIHNDDESFSELKETPDGEWVKFSDANMILESLKELMSIVKIHSRHTDNNFAWAEMSEAERTLRSLTTASTASHEAKELC